MSNLTWNEKWVIVKFDKAKLFEQVKWSEQSQARADTSTSYLRNWMRQRAVVSTSKSGRVRVDWDLLTCQAFNGSHKYKAPSIMATIVVKALVSRDTTSVHLPLYSLTWLTNSVLDDVTDQSVTLSKLATNSFSKVESPKHSHLSSVTSATTQNTYIEAVITMSPTQAVYNQLAIDHLTMLSFENLSPLSTILINATTIVRSN